MYESGSQRENDETDKHYGKNTIPADEQLELDSAVWVLEASVTMTTAVKSLQNYPLTDD